MKKEEEYVMEHTLPGRRFYITFEEGEVTVEGCSSVLTYRDEVILLRLSEQNLRISGSGLLLKSYFDGEMQVSGKISGLELENR